MNRSTLLLGAAALCLPIVALPVWAQSTGAVGAEWRWLTFTVFAAIIGLTMFVTYLASKQVKSASDFYTAGAMSKLAQVVLAGQKRLFN